MAEYLKTYIHKIRKQLKNTGMRAQGNSGSTMVRLNGMRLAIRPACPDDAARLFQMHQRLSRETLYFRYLTLYRPQMKEMEMVCGMPASEGAALVAQRNTPDGTIVGLAYYRFDQSHPAGSPEFAIVVEDRFQGCGVGKALLKHLCRHAASMGIQTLFASIHHQNRRMQHLLHCTGYQFDERNDDDDTVEATIQLQAGEVYKGHRFFKPGVRRIYSHDWI